MGFIDLGVVKQRDQVLDKNGVEAGTKGIYA